MSYRKNHNAPGISGHLNPHRGFERVSPTLCLTPSINFRPISSTHHNGWLGFLRSLWHPLPPHPPPPPAVPKASKPLEHAGPSYKHVYHFGLAGFGWDNNAGLQNDTQRSGLAWPHTPDGPALSHDDNVTILIFITGGGRARERNIRIRIRSARFAACHPEPKPRT